MARDSSQTFPEGTGQIFSPPPPYQLVCDNETIDPPPPYEDEDIVQVQERECNDGASRSPSSEITSEDNVSSTSSSVTTMTQRISVVSVNSSCITQDSTV